MRSLLFGDQGTLTLAVYHAGHEHRAVFDYGHVGLPYKAVAWESGDLRYPKLWRCRSQRLR